MADELHVLAGAYALDALDGDELRDFEAHLATCAECRAEVAELREVAARLGSSEALAPPPRVRSAVLAQIAGTAQERPSAAPAPVDGATVASLDDARPDRGGGPTTADTSGRGGRPGRRILAIAAALVLIAGAVGAGVAISRLSDRADTAEDLAALVARPDAVTFKLEGADHPGINVVFSPEEGRAALLADGLERVPDDRTYELWAIRGGSPDKVALFNADPDGALRTTIDTDLGEPDALAVTVEPAGGSPAPTTDIILSTATG
jgi:anti-sigma-K factor RskA